MACYRLAARMWLVDVLNNKCKWSFGAGISVVAIQLCFPTRCTQNPQI